MPFSFEQSKDEIARLVKHFLANQATYRAPAYKEAHARQEFIDPLFVALNWDVANRQQAAPDEREAIVEDSLPMEGQAARKAPDYAFRVGRERKFFAGAKDAAEQARLQRLIDSTDKQIDALVYELYGLSPDEIAVVENAGQ